MFKTSWSWLQYLADMHMASMPFKLLSFCDSQLVSLNPIMVLIFVQEHEYDKILSLESLQFASIHSLVRLVNYAVIKVPAPS